MLYWVRVAYPRLFVHSLPYDFTSAINEDIIIIADFAEIKVGGDCYDILVLRHSDHSTICCHKTLVEVTCDVSTETCCGHLVAFGEVCLAVAVVIGIDLALVDEFVGFVFKMAHREDAEIVDNFAAVFITADGVVSFHQIKTFICEIGVAIAERQHEVEMLVIYRSLVTFADAPVLHIARDTDIVEFVG